MTSPLLYGVILCTATLWGSTATPPLDPESSGRKELKVGRLMKTCTRCHLNEHAEWQNSAHAKAWTNAVFQEAIAKRDDSGEACAPCHAPGSVFDTGIGNIPKARPGDREHGVNCITCHMDGKKIYYGPMASEAHKGVVVKQEYRDSKWCSSCHGHPEAHRHDHYTSFAASPASKAGLTCQTCHMPEIVRPMARAKKKLKRVQPPQKCREHRFSVRVAHGKIADAAKVSGRFEAGKLLVTVEAHGGHSLLATPDRQLELLVELRGSDGTSLKQLRRAFGHKSADKPEPGISTDYEFECPPEATVARYTLILVQPAHEQQRRVVGAGECGPD